MAKAEIPMSERPSAQMALSSREDQARHEIKAQLRAHNDLIFDFTAAWYRSPYTFRSTKFMGYPACKIPFDLWILHDLFCQYRFETVIETGTAGGGTTLWYAMLMEMLGIDGAVLSIDIDALDEGRQRPVHPRITYLTGSSVDPVIVAKADTWLLEHQKKDAEGKVGAMLMNLDSNHHAPHVLEELRMWAPRVPIGSWMLVEDTNGAPVMQDVGGNPIEVEGPLAAVFEYMASHPDEWFRDVVCERYWVTMNPHGWLQRHRVWNGR